MPMPPLTGKPRLGNPMRLRPRLFATAAQLFAIAVQLGATSRRSIIRRATHDRPLSYLEEQFLTRVERGG